MKYNIFILEDDKDNIVVYKLVLKDFNLFIFENFESALDFIISPEFEKINLAIIDVNLGFGFKISGFNVIYRILKKYPTIPIIICTAYRNDNNVEKYAKIIGAKLIEKPVNSKMVGTINAIVNNKSDNFFGEIEHQVREFMTGAMYLKNILNLDISMPPEYLDKLDKLDKIEERIFSNLEYIKESLVLPEKEIKKEQKFTVIKTFKNDLCFFIKTLIGIIELTLYSQLNLSADEIIFVEEISSLGEKIISQMENKI